MSPFEVVPAARVDATELASFVERAWSGPFVVAHGERFRPAALPGFVALRGGRIVGHAAYRVRDERIELVALVADPPRAGIGSSLLDAVLEAGRAAGCQRAWLTTTNDNLDALRFYQRRGFALAALRRGAVAEARRTLKPSIPTVGLHGIPMRDELDLERDL